MKIFELIDALLACSENRDVKFALCDVENTKCREAEGKVVGLIEKDGGVIILCKKYAAVDEVLDNVFNRAGALGQSVEHDDFGKDEKKMV